MLRKKQIASYIDANFGKSPLDGGMYYDGTGRMKLIREYHEMRECESEVDAITWEDLEMDRIFLSVNHTNCFAGEQVLYDRLHRTDSLCDENEAEKYEQQLESWMSHPKDRLQVEEKLYEIGKFENDYLFVSLIEDVKNWKLDNLWFLRLMQVLLAVCLFGTIVLQSQVCGVGLTVVITINLMIYLRTKNRYEMFFSGLGCLKKLYDFAEWITGGKAEMCTWVDKQQAMEAQIDQLEEQKQKLQGSIDLCRKIVSDQAYENLDVAYYMNYVKAEEADGKKFADIGALLEDFSECTRLELLLNDMGRYRLFADHRVKSVARIVWFVYLLAFPVVEIGLTCAGVCEWSAARVIFFGFWLAMLVSTFVEYRKEKG